MSDPSGLAALISASTKAVLVALVATGILPWDDTAVSAVALAVAGIIDVGVVLGLIRPRVTPLVAPRTNDGVPLVPAPPTD